MNVRIIRGVEIERPTTTPLKSSILDHAKVVGNSAWGLRNNEGLWPSYNCIDTLVPTVLCPDPLADVGKTFAFPEWVPGFEFAVYGAVKCRAVGLDEADMRAEIVRVFGLNEGKGVERALLENRFVASGSDDAPAAWDAPVDITPGGGLTLPQALAAVEGHAASIYAGVPTIHMPRAAASLLGSDKIVWTDGVAYTRLGSKVAIGGGYDSGSVPADGTFDIFATGEVYVERSEEVVVNSYVLPGDGSGLGSGENGLPDNTVVGLVERVFRVGVDCFVVKATGTAWT